MIRSILGFMLLLFIVLSLYLFLSLKIQNLIKFDISIFFILLFITIHIYPKIEAMLANASYWKEHSLLLTPLILLPAIVLFIEMTYIRGGFISSKPFWEYFISQNISNTEKFILDNHASECVYFALLFSSCFYLYAKVTKKGGLINVILVNEEQQQKSISFAVMGLLISSVVIFYMINYAEINSHISSYYSRALEVFFVAFSSFIATTLFTAHKQRKMSLREKFIFIFTPLIPLALISFEMNLLIKTLQNDSFSFSNYPTYHLELWNQLLTLPLLKNVMIYISLLAGSIALITSFNETLKTKIFRV